MILGNDPAVDELLRRVSSLEQQLSELKGKLRPGSVFVRDNTFKQVLSETFILPAALTVRGPFDISPDLELATYVMSMRMVEANADTVEYAGADIITGTAVFAAIQRVYRQGPPNDRLESFVSYFNNTNEPKEITIKVWRILGLI